MSKFFMRMAQASRFGSLSPRKDKTLSLKDESLKSLLYFLKAVSGQFGL